MTINRGMSRLPREKLGGGGLGKVRMVPQSVGGRVAHPPKKEKNYEKKINMKEYMLALKSAIAALANKELAMKRGHKVEKIKDNCPSLKFLMRIAGCRSGIVGLEREGIS